MADKPKATLADYVVIALSPALIMGLIGSLVFFLLEVFYRGQYGSNLRWILFFYVFGAVLAARLTVSGEAEGRGLLYSVILGVLTWIGALRFAEYPPDSPAASQSGLINLFLVGLIGWSASRLVRDCTHIDDSMEVDACGLLEASGLEEQEQGVVPPSEAQRTASKAQRAASKKSWLERWWAYREASKKKRTPGVWVVYFSLAALPLFGMGQAFIPPQAGDRRAYTFALLVLYLACGLGLLLTTCFLGLRRYLRQRKLTMPASMTGAWLLLGTLAIVLLLGATALIPRPEAGYSALDQPPPPVAEERGSSQVAQVKDGKGKDQQSPQDKAEKDAKAGQARDRDSTDRDKDGGKGQKDGQKDRPGGEKDRKDAAGQKDGQKDGPSKTEGQGQEATPPPTPNFQPLTNLLQQIGPWAKWIVFALLAVIVLFWLIRNGLRYLANFTEWARKLLAWFQNFWANLFGGGTGSGGDDESAMVAEPEPRPFKSYPDPFLTGASEGMDDRDLVRYTFAALQAWGREQGLPRRPDETPMEYAGRLASEHPDLAEWIRKLTSLYARAVYGFGRLPDATEDFLREFWQALDAAGTSAT